MQQLFILTIVLAIADEWRIAEDVTEPDDLFIIAQSFIGVDISHIYVPTAIMLAGINVTLLSYVSI